MNIALIGSSGKMGKLFSTVATTNKTDHIVACVDITDSQDPTMPYLSHKQHKTIWSVKEKLDLIIDFSTSLSKEDVINFALLNNLPLAVFSTTCSEEDKAMLKAASKHIPILLCPNTSRGVNSMIRALDILSQSLNMADVLVEEIHHKNKLDSPSGTAKKIVDLLSSNGIENIKVNSFRGGTECGYHAVRFLLDDEEIIITHRATSRKIFALGAYEMAKKLLSKNNGFFTHLE